VKTLVTIFIGVLIIRTLLPAQETAKGGSCGLAAPPDGGMVQVLCSSLTADQMTLLKNLPAFLNKLLLSRQKPTDLQALLDGCVSSRGPVRSYSFDGGLERVAEPDGKKSATARRPPESFARMQELERTGQWQELIKLCEEQIAAMPEWLTPRLFEGIAYARTGNAIEAVRLLQFVQDMAQGDPAYARAGEELRQIAKAK